MDTVASLRAQRAEVEALLAFHHAEAGEAECLAWWRLQRARVARRALQPAAILTPLPAPPAKALSWWQGFKQRLGRLRAEQETPPPRFARQLRP